VLEKAQNLKRKVHLEENPGIKSFSSNVITDVDMMVVAKNLDIKTGNSNTSEEVVKSMIDLDSSRNNSFSSTCNNQECCPIEVDDEKDQVDQGEAPVTPPKQMKAQKLEELIDALSEKVPREK
jgi:hypothetical protein